MTAAIPYADGSPTSYGNVEWFGESRSGTMFAVVQFEQALADSISTTFNTPIREVWTAIQFELGVITPTYIHHFLIPPNCGFTPDVMASLSTFLRSVYPLMPGPLPAAEIEYLIAESEKFMYGWEREPVNTPFA